MRRDNENLFRSVTNYGGVWKKGAGKWGLECTAMGHLNASNKQTNKKDDNKKIKKIFKNI